MELHGWIALGTLIVAAFFFLTRLVALEIVALAIPLVLFVTGTVPDAATALVGFGNHAVIALAAIFVLGGGLKECGVAELMARGVGRVGGTSERRFVVVVCVFGALLSAFTSNTATVAVMLPAIVALSRRAGLAPSRLLMPLGFASILGGNLTLIGTAPNLLVSDYLRETEGHGFGMFDFALVGLPIVAAGILYLVVVGRRLLPTRLREDRFRDADLPESLAKDYNLDALLTRVRVGPDSPLVGKTLGETGLGRRYGLSVLLVVRSGPLGARYRRPGQQLRLERGDELYLQGPRAAVQRMCEGEQVSLGSVDDQHLERVLDNGVSLAEVVVSPRSAAVGRTIVDLELRGKHGVNVLALWRRGEAVQEDLAQTALQDGDTLLVGGQAARIRGLEGDFVLITGLGEARDLRRAPLAFALLLLAVLPPLLGLAPLAVSALGAAVLMLATGCVSPASIASAVEWKVLALVIGTLPLGHALEAHAVAARAASILTDVAASAGAPAVLGLLFVLAAGISVTSSNAAAAVILAPVAAEAARLSGFGTREALLAVAYGCSCAFLVPFAHPCNLMVMGPGAYRTADFLRVGGGLTLVVVVVAVTGLALL
ncbi:MAG: SLC13 family permease [Planctomycetota bacterium]|nr:SLC13 family permease [Planctomycetota bacterium]